LPIEWDDEAKVMKEEIKLYIIKPKGLPDFDQPCNIFMHGGGAIMFDADMYLSYGKRQALKLNCVVVVPDFRNAPEAKTP
jgi:acetyl esterase/lipase